MKRLYQLILLVTIAFIAFNCQKEVNHAGTGTPGGGNTPTDPITATLQGNVINELGQPAMGVTIKVGTKTVTTNARGYFRIVNASLDKSVSLVTAEKTGYFKAYRTFGASSGVNQVIIQLIKKSSSGTVNSTAGGTITLSNGSKITLPADGVVKASGGSYSGSVNVYAAYIDPSSPDIAKLVPGSFIANDKNNNRAILASYGMVAVELESSAGEKLQIASGKTATLTTAIPSSLQASAPATISLWYVDEQTGIWKEEGTATKNGTNYAGEVKHFTYWNCDVPVPTINLSATFKNTAGLPLVYNEIRIRPVSGYSSSAHGYTDSLGQLNGPVPANMNLIMEVMSPCNTVMYSQNVGPFSSNTNLGVITVDNNPSLVTVQGKLLNCSGTAVTNGFAVINYNNIIRYVSVQNAAGDFAATFTTCGGMPATCEVYGVDAAAQQSGITTNVTITTPTTNTGNIVACGTSTLQFINYNVDGINHSVSSLVAGDNFTGSSYDSLSVTGSYIYGNHNNITDVSFSFQNNRTEGSFPIQYLFVQGFNNVTPVAPFTIILTNYPDAAGDFFEGSFSGQFKDGLNATHTISGTFRIRRS
jgi:hypothetical protein